MLQVGYMGLDSTARGPSSLLWGRIPVPLLLRGEGGHGLFNDFDSTLNGYDTLAGTGCTTALGSSTTGQYGTLVQTFDGTANDECSIQADGGAFWVDASPNQRIAFEARVKKSTITAAVGGLFLGLADAGQAATSTMVDTTGVLETTGNFLGFHVAMGTSASVCNFIYQAASVTPVTLIAAVHTFVADTYVKLGFLVDPLEPNPAKRLKVYVNGAEQSTYGTDTIVATSAFPKNTGMAPIFHGKVGSGAAATVHTMDWWQCVAEDHG